MDLLFLCLVIGAVQEINAQAAATANAYANSNVGFM